MPGSLKTEAVVLRSIRYGEADRILHLYTPDLGRIGAIAKGVRRARSRFGGRLEPYSRVALVLHQGRSDLMTVTGRGHDRLQRASARARARPRRRGARVRRGEPAVRGRRAPSAGAITCSANQLALLDREPERATLANQLAFRLKLLVAAGLAPQLGSCASCGEAEELVGFSGAAGGVVCGACEAGAFPLGEEAHAFMTGALGAPLAQAPDADVRALRQAERAITETAEHHAGVHLRAAVS